MATSRIRLVAALALGATHAAGCASAQRASTSRADGPDASGADAPIASPSSASPAPQSSLPQLPAPPSSPSSSSTPLPDVPHVAYRGSDPFEPPPAGPIALAPTPPRPPGSDPSPSDLASAPPYCAKLTECADCNNAGRCGFCMATSTCVPKDASGPFPGTCSAGFTPKSCPLSIYTAKTGPRLRESLTFQLRGLQPEGMPIDTKIDGGARVVRIPVRRGYCYGLVFRTSADVDNPWGLNAIATPEATFFEEGGEWMPLYTGAAVLTPFCPQQAGSIVVGIAPKKGVSTRGTWRAQLFRKAISEDALRDATDKREAERRQRAVRYVCGHCTRVYLVCRLYDADAECTAGFVACLKIDGLRPGDCERGDVPRPPKPPTTQPFDVSNAPPVEPREG